jgi:hypothetical protein
MARVQKVATLNGLCPYYTMYPLDFPLQVLANHMGSQEWILDPFCGRGTTNFAARWRGLPSVGIDSSPIAVAIAKAKLLRVSIDAVVAAAEAALAESSDPLDIPEGEFWSWAYHQETLGELCRLRAALMLNCNEPARIMLRAIILGALHGPIRKGEPSYLSNQSPRTFAPKPAYAVRFWKKRDLLPPRVKVISIIQRKARYYLSEQPESVSGCIIQADSRQPETFDSLPRFSLVITSPPYYGMRTYIPDQWLRRWFLGGLPEVVYQQPDDQMTHGSPEVFVQQLAQVWRNVARACQPHAKLVCRFGGIQERKQEPLALLKASLREAGWHTTAIRDAGSALDGKRQATQFGERTRNKPRPEYDIYALLAG